MRQALVLYVGPHFPTTSIDVSAAAVRNNLGCTFEIQTDTLAAHKKGPRGQGCMEGEVILRRGPEIVDQSFFAVWATVSV